MTAAQAVAELKGRGFVLHPLKGKIPIMKRWQELTATPDDIDNHIENGGNVGAVCGKASNITAIDLDSMLFASEIFNGAKIETLCAERIEGRGHVYFKYNPNLPASKHHTLGIEILSDGNNIVLPPSKHPSGDVYHWKNPDAPILDMPAEIETNLLRLFKTEIELKKILAICRHCFRDVIKRKPDMHGADGRDYMLSVCTDLKANDADEQHIRMFARLMYREKFDEERTMQEWRNIDPAKTWTCETLKAKLPAYVDLAECEKCDARKTAFQNRPDLTAPPSLINDASFTDTGNAKLLVSMFGDRIRYCHPWKTWMCYNGKYWERDNSGQILRYAKEAIEVELADAENELRKDPSGELEKKRRKNALFSLSATKRKAMVFLAESEPTMAILPDDLDKNKMLFNVQNGTVELDYITGQGKLREHKKEDYITRISPAVYNASAKGELWMPFLNKITNSDPELIKYMQKLAGQLLCGAVREKALYVLHGKKHTGKTTFIETLADILNEYAETMAIESLMKKSRGGIPNDIAALKGKRFVFVDEPDFGDKLSEGIIKKLTGLDTINARFLNEEFFKFKPEFKLWIACNTFPDITDKDQAIWGRVLKIPFLVQIKENEMDKSLQEKLILERSVVLKWMIEGCLLWQKEGMEPPESVQKATEDIKEDMDTLADFFKICCITGEKYKIPHEYLYTAFRLWAITVGRNPMSKKAFTQVCENRDYDRTNAIYIGTKKYRGFGGITLTDWMINSVQRYLTEPDNEKEILRVVYTDFHASIGRQEENSYLCEKTMCEKRSVCSCITKMCILSLPILPENESNNNLQILIRDKLKKNYDHFNKPDSILDLGRLQKTMEGYILNEIEGSEAVDVGRYVDDYCKARQW